MSRAPESGFYFEPISERLALVVEGSPFPTDDQWAFVGDPIEMTPELARLQVALRWPGVDPDLLEVELDTGMDRMLGQIAADAADDHAVSPPDAAPVSDAAQAQGLLAQAAELEKIAAALQDRTITREQLEAEVERIDRERAALAARGTKAPAGQHGGGPDAAQGTKKPRG